MTLTNIIAIIATIAVTSGLSSYVFRLIELGKRGSVDEKTNEAKEKILEQEGKVEDAKTRAKEAVTRYHNLIKRLK